MSSLPILCMIEDAIDIKRELKSGFTAEACKTENEGGEGLADAAGTGVNTALDVDVA